MSLTTQNILPICVVCGLDRSSVPCADRPFFSEWRPNADTRGIRYVGNKVCADCHPREAAQLTTPMANALEVAPDCKILAARNRLTFKNGNYTYELARQGKGVVYTVSDGVKKVLRPRSCIASARATWAKIYSLSLPGRAL